MRFSQRYMRRLLLVLFPLSFLFVVLWVIYNSLFYIPCFELNDAEYQLDADFIRSLDVRRTGIPSPSPEERKARNTRKDPSKQLEEFRSHMEEVYQKLDYSHLQTDFSKKHLPFRYSSVMVSVNEYDPNHFEILKESKYIGSHKAFASLTYLRTFLTENYYVPASSSCSILQNQSIAVPAVDFHCEADIIQSLLPSPLSLEDFKTGMPKNFTSSASSIMTNYIYLVRNGIASEYGDVFAQDGHVVIARCRQHWKKQTDPIYTSKVEDLELYDEVFSVSQLWAYGYFHAVIEQIPRVIPYIDYLKSHPKIKIQVYSKEDFVIKIFDSLGISEERIITGTLRAKLLYVPSGGRCGNTPIFNAQLFSLHLRQSLPTLPAKRSILLVKRSHKRYFACHDKILEMLRKLASAYNIDVEVYPDDPVPSQSDSAIMFNRALMIVAPHGAGLGNLMYADPGTVVIEGLCYSPGDHLVNLCYANLARHLGMRYYGLVFSSKECWEIQAADIRPVAKFYLQYLLK